MPGVLWEAEAEKELGGVPFFVRPLARRKIQEWVQSRGRERVTLADVREAEARFRSAMAGKSEHEIERMMPQPNRPGAAMVIVETCHNELSHCPNVLIKTAEWRKAVEDWAREKDISERCRRRVKADRILYHHKLRISISGCPNGCSRPQIADVGLVGWVRPDVEPEACVVCGECPRACPDDAITVEGAPPVFDRPKCCGCLKCRDACERKCIHLSAPGATLLLGGKLGRHPHLADKVGVVQSPDDAVCRIDAVLADYFEHAEPDERFADFWVRAGSKEVATSK